MEQPSQEQFKQAKSGALSMSLAIQKARSEIASISDLPVDSVVRSERGPDGSWTVVLELIESAARMGENDFLSAYELHLDEAGTLIQLDRLGRYRREDGASA